MVGRMAAAILLLGILLTVSCGVLAHRKDAYEIGSRSRGIASWYGKDYHGRPTASGEIYDMYGLSAAHRTMPLRSTIRVTNRNNGRTATLRLNDRGPFIRGRVLDVSYGAAEALGFVEAGLAPVEFEIIGRDGRPGRPRAGRRQDRQPAAERDGAASFTVQVGAFTEEENAERLKAQLSRRYGPVRIEQYRTNSLTYYRVRVGAFPSEWQARQIAGQLEAAEGDLEGFVTQVEDR